MSRFEEQFDRLETGMFKAAFDEAALKSYTTSDVILCQLRNATAA